MSVGQRTPGPIHLFGRVRANSTALYLGTAVAAPEPEHEKFRIPVMNDLGGRSVPFQEVTDGETAMVFATLNRFDYSMLQAIRALDGLPPGAITNPQAGSLLAGQELQFQRGTLTFGLKDWQLLLIYEYAGTTSSGVFAGGVSDLPRGRLYASSVIRKYKESTVGTRVQEVALAIECNNIWAPPNGNNFGSFSGGGGQTLAGLYTEDVSLFGPVGPVA